MGLKWVGLIQERKGVKLTQFPYLKDDFSFVLIFCIFQIFSNGTHYFYHIKSKKEKD